MNHFRRQINLFTLVRATTLIMARVTLIKRGLDHHMTTIRNFRRNRKIVTQTRDQTQLHPILYRNTRTFRTLMINQGATHPRRARRTRHHRHASMRHALTPVSTTTFTFIRANRVNLKRGRTTRRVIGRPQATATRDQRCTDIRPRVNTSTNNNLIRFLNRIQYTNRMGATRLTSALMTITNRHRISRRTRALTSLPRLVQRIRGTTATLDITLLIRTRSRLTIRTARRLFRLNTRRNGINTTLFFTRANTRRLVTFFTNRLVRRLIRARRLIDLTRRRVGQRVSIRFLVRILRTNARLTHRNIRILFTTTRRNFRQGNRRRTIRQAITTAFTRRIRRDTPNTTVSFNVHLNRMTTDNISRRAIVNGVPITVANTRNITNRLTVSLISQGLGTQRIRRANLTTTL